MEAERPAEVRSTITAAGDTQKVVTLWDGRKLTVNSDTNIVTGPATTTGTHEPQLSKSAVRAKVASVKKTYISAEEEVRAYFADIPIMVDIARCESRYRHYDTTGGVLRGVVNNLDRGVMQINEGYHAKTATQLGIDILTLEGNLAYARYLYQTQGTNPWVSSSPCWGSSNNSQVAVN
jgi:hypothetical protein